MLKLIAENVIDHRITENSYRHIEVNLYLAKPCMVQTISQVKNLFDRLTMSFEGSHNEIVILNTFEMQIINLFIVSFIPQQSRLGLYYTQNNVLTGKKIILGLNLMIHLQREFTFSLAPLEKKSTSSPGEYFQFTYHFAQFITEVDSRVFARSVLESQILSPCMAKPPRGYPMPKQ